MNNWNKSLWEKNFGTKLGEYISWVGFGYDWMQKRLDYIEPKSKIIKKTDLIRDLKDRIMKLKMISIWERYDYQSQSLWAKLVYKKYQIRSTRAKYK